MSHSLHRVGDYDDLGCDYVVIVRAIKGYNRIGSVEKCKEILRLFHKHGAISITTGARRKHYQGNFMEDHDIQSLIDSFKDGDSPHCVFDSREKLQSFLRDLKERDFGLSVVISGLFKEVSKICELSGIKPHTTAHSLGIWGNGELIPKGPALEIITMCGHGLVSRHLLERLVDDIKAGRATIETAAVKLAKPCLCGLFNPNRAEILLRKLIADPDACYADAEVNGWPTQKTG
jgi:hypothetical protein